MAPKNNGNNANQAPHNQAVTLTPDSVTAVREGWFRSWGAKLITILVPIIATLITGYVSEFSLKHCVISEKLFQGDFLDFNSGKKVAGHCVYNPFGLKIKNSIEVHFTVEKPSNTELVFENPKLSSLCNDTNLTNIKKIDIKGPIGGIFSYASVQKKEDVKPILFKNKGLRNYSMTFKGAGLQEKRIPVLYYLWNFSDNDFISKVNIYVDGNLCKIQKDYDMISSRRLFYLSAIILGIAIGYWSGNYTLKKYKDPIIK